MKTYEAMFLLDAGNPDFEAASQPVRQILTRINAEIISFKQWDERRLAYEMKGRKRALYILTYFKANPLEIHNLEHDVQISELILRAQVLSADDATPEQINAPTPHETGASRHWDDRRDDDRGDRGDLGDRYPRRDRGESYGRRESEAPASAPAAEAAAPEAAEGADKD